MDFTWSKKRKYLLGLAMLFLITGYMLMFYKDTNMRELNVEIYNFRRITLAPIFVLLGYSVIAVAIMIKTKH